MMKDYFTVNGIHIQVVQDWRIGGLAKVQLGGVEQGIFWRFIGTILSRNLLSSKKRETPPFAGGNVVPL